MDLELDQYLPLEGAVVQMAAKKESTVKKGKTLSVEEFHTALKKQVTSASGTPNLLQALKAAQMKPQILFLGCEPLRIRRLIQWIRNSFAPSKQDSVSTYFGSELSNSLLLDNIVQALSTPSLFTPTEIIVIYEFEKVKAAGVKQLLEVWERSVQCGVTLLTMESLGERKSEIAELATVVQVSSLPDSQLERWVLKEVERAGVSGGIAQEAVSLLVQTFGSDLTSLSQEISKLALMADRGEQISKKLLLEVLEKTPERTSFTLVQEMAAKHVSSALRLTDELLEQGLHPLQLSSFLSRSFRTMLATRASLGSKAPIHSELTNPWFVRNTSRAASAFIPEHLEASIEVLKKLDLQLKSSSPPADVAMSLAVQRITSREFAA